MKLFNYEVTWPKYQDNKQERIDEVLDYCYPFVQHMWAAQVIATLLGCDFREARVAYLKHKGLS